LRQPNNRYYPDYKPIYYSIQANKSNK